MSEAEGKEGLQKEDLRNLFTFLHLKEKLNDIVVSDKNTLRNLKLKNGDAYGVNSVLQTLCKENPLSKGYLGRTPEEKALTRQWLEYNLSFLDSNSFITPTHLRELDTSLIAFTFFGGNVITVADILIYFSLYPTLNQISFHEKGEYPNLSRWFRLIQEYSEIRGSRDKICFSDTDTPLSD